MAVVGYHLGGPLWGARVWQDDFFAPGTRAEDYLAAYGSVFNTVEGNTTFYKVPSIETARRWAAAVPEGFRFCFKVPRTISHDAMLQPPSSELRRFVDALEPLADRLGPLFVQLSPAFGPERLGVLAGFLDGLPAHFERVVEVRHPAFFDGGPAERALDELLVARGADRAVMDTRALRAAVGPHDEPTRQALVRKPDLPVRPIGLGPRPFVRFVARPVPRSNGPWMAAWADVVCQWIAEGRTPYVFMHSPGDADVPTLARAFHQMLLRRGAPVGELPPWPAETAASQLSLI